MDMEQSPVIRFMRALVLRTWLGLVLVAIAVVAAFAATILWDAPIEGYGWRVVTVAFLVAGVLLLALIEEIGRPQNPYKNIDPRFSYMDAGPTGQLSSASSAWLWHALPPLVAAGAIVLSLILT